MALFVEQMRNVFWLERWEKTCPQGHLVRHDKCDLTCEVVPIKPFPTPFFTQMPKSNIPGTTHAWVTGSTDEFLDTQVGWWWRKPWSWWMSLWSRVEQWAENHPRRKS